MDMGKFDNNNWSNSTPDQKKEILQEAFEQNNWKKLDEDQRLLVANRVEDYNAKP